MLNANIFEKLNVETLFFLFYFKKVIIHIFIELFWAIFGSKRIKKPYLEIS